MIDNPIPEKVEPLLRLEEVARRLNISRSQAYRLAVTELRCVRFGLKTVRVRQSDLEEYIAGHLQGGDHD